MYRFSLGELQKLGEIGEVCGGLGGLPEVAGGDSGHEFMPCCTRAIEGCDVMERSKYVGD